MHAKHRNGKLTTRLGLSLVAVATRPRCDPPLGRRILRRKLRLLRRAQLLAEEPLPPRPAALQLLSMFLCDTEQSVWKKQLE